MSGRRGDGGRVRGGWAVRAAVLTLTGVMVLAACGSGSSAGPSADSGRPGTPGGTAATATLAGRVTVFAAASLTGSFTEMARDFERAHPDVTVTLNLAGSSALAQQIVAGAPADVFAAASPATMKTVVEAGDAEGQPVVFARNTLEIAVPAGNPGKVTGLADFGREELTLAVCAAQVPCGVAAGKVFTAAGITPRPDTLEQDVKAVLAKTTLGEVDAGLVYRTDVLAAGAKVEGINFPGSSAAANDYPLAVLADAPNPDAAAAFVAAVTSPAGLEILTRAGFTRP